VTGNGYWQTIVIVRRRACVNKIALGDKGASSLSEANARSTQPLPMTIVLKQTNSSPPGNSTRAYRADMMRARSESPAIELYSNTDHCSVSSNLSQTARERSWSSHSIPVWSAGGLILEPARMLCFMCCTS
jgi:hypothetical protein